MDINELKELLISEQSVSYNAPRFHFDDVTVSAIIIRNKNGKLEISAELKDKSRAVYIVFPKYIKANKKQKAFSYRSGLK